MTRRFLTLSVLLTVPFLLSACADVPKSPEAQTETQISNDPLESVNRVTFDVNDFMDRLLIRPLTELYRFTIPDMIRDRVAHVLSNMGEPVIMANNLLQGKWNAAETTATRFAVNTTAGVAGIFEVAEDWGYAKQMGDFGQTLSVWGVGSGPYLVLPLFGPSTVRDAAGLGVGMVADPWHYAAADGGRTVRDAYDYTAAAASGLTQREENLDALDALRAGSLDFYAEMRSVYLQYRDKQLGIENPDSTPKFEDYE